MFNFSSLLKSCCCSVLYFKHYRNGKNLQRIIEKQIIYDENKKINLLLFLYLANQIEYAFLYVNINQAGVVVQSLDKSLPMDNSVSTVCGVV